MIICRRTWNTGDFVYWRWFHKGFCHNAPGIKPNGYISCCHPVQEPFRPKDCHKHCFIRPQSESRNIFWEINKLWYFFSRDMVKGHWSNLIFLNLFVNNALPMLFLVSKQNVCVRRRVIGEIKSSQLFIM